MSARDTSLATLEQRLGFVFLDRSLLDQALTHSSYANEHRVPDNERLEFLGDAVLQLAASELLVKRFPTAREGQLSRLRSRLVDKRALVAIARALELGPLLRLGVGEEGSGGRTKERNLAGATEAVLGAIFAASGSYAEAAAIAHDWIREKLKILDDKRVDLHWKDPKSGLQEAVQGQGGETPRYRVVDRTGPDHLPVFTVEVFLPNGAVLGTGQGSSMKAAEKEAARAALEALPS